MESVIAAYVDTNILISNYTERELFYFECQAIFRATNLAFFSGFITVLEFASRIREMWLSRQISLDQVTMNSISRLSESQQINIVVQDCIARLPIKIIPASALEKVTIGQTEYVTENSFTLAYQMAPQIRLRACNLLQIASALKIKLYTNNKIQYFITNDQKILDLSGTIRLVTGIIPISSKDLLNLLQIKLP